MGNNDTMDQFFTRYQSCCFARKPLQWQHRNLANWKQWTEWHLSCHVWNATRVFRFWFFWPWGPSTGIHHCHSSRPNDGTFLRQQMLLTQGVIDLLYRTGPGLQQQPVQQTPTVAQNSTSQSERLTMDTKWIPAAPLPDWKSWNSRAKELAGFKGWLEKFASWLCLVHDSYATELKEAMILPYPVVTVSQDQAIRSRRLFHLL